MRVTRLLFFVVLSFTGLASVWATPTFSVVRDTAFPSQIVKGDTAVATYTITNNVPKISFSGITLQKLGGTTQVTGSGLCPKAPFALAAGASCVLKLQYAATAVRSVSGGPEVCPDSTGANCSEPADPSQKINFSVIASPSTDMPTLSVPTTLYLVPGETTVFTVTNPSTATQAANNVRVIAPTSLANDISSSDCDSIAPGSSCEIAVTTASGISSVDEASFTVTGSNTQSRSVTATLTSSLLSASAVSFSTPGSQDMTLTNYSGADMSISSVSTAVSGVTAGSVPSSCQILASDSSCTVKFTASSSAHGTGTAHINYSVSGQSKTATGAVGVASTTLSINSGNDLEVRANGSATYEITNTGNFKWQGASVSLANLSGVSLDADDCTNEALAPGDSCNLLFESENATEGSAADISVSGDNIAQTGASIVVGPGVGISLDNSTANIHLQDRAIKISNLTDTAQTLSANLVSISSSLINKLVECPEGGSNCNYQSTCVAGGTLAAGANCLIWLEAKAPSDQGLGASSGTVTIHANKLDSKTYDLTYENDLYAGGDTEVTANDYVSLIARWDGSSWMTLGEASTGGIVYALQAFQGDLIAGGNFTDLQGTDLQRIGRWNGESWLPLIVSGTNGVNDYVRALTTGTDGTLYAGGSFTQAGGETANYVAAWDGATWAPLGVEVGNGLNGPVFALTMGLDNKLYVGGNFTIAGEASANYVAAWDGATWAPLGAEVGNGLNYPVFALTMGPDGKFYVGGRFTLAGGDTANNVAAWDGSTWTSLGTDATNGVNDYVDALTTDSDGRLYVGGGFFKAGGVNANYVAAWDDPGWEPLGRFGLTGDVFTFGFGANGVLYAGGSISIAAWDGNSWLPLAQDNQFDWVQSIKILPRIAAITPEAALKNHQNEPAQSQQK